jgi:hypothetical protein
MDFRKIAGRARSGALALKNIPYRLSILGSPERLSYERAAVHFSGGFFDGKEG